MLVKIGWQKYQYNKEISMMIKPLEFEAYQQVITLQENVSEEKGPNKDFKSLGVEMLKNPDVMNFIDGILEENVKDITGLDIEIEGEIKPATIKDIVKHGTFTLVKINIFSKLFSISNLTGAEETELKKK